MADQLDLELPNSDRLACWAVICTDFGARHIDKGRFLLSINFCTGVGYLETLQKFYTMYWGCNQSAWLLMFLLGVWVLLNRVSRGSGQSFGEATAFYHN